jgi:glyoxylate/hydroxypyruvate reductase A
MALLFISTFKTEKAWIKELRKQASDIEVYVWPNVPDPAKVEFIASWSYEDLDYHTFPNLKCVSSLVAGIDHIELDKIPAKIPIARIVDPMMRVQMSEYVALAVLNHRRHLIEYKQQQIVKKWEKIPEIDMADLTVGIMGIGSLGMDAALKLKKLGYPVIGWGRSPKTIKEIPVFIGQKELKDFLIRADILVCFLPVTEQTKNILNYKNLSMLPRGAYVINVARGVLLVDEDLIKLLDNHHLSGACLDVFRQEPLPNDHPFWRHAKIIITPHMSSNPIIQTTIQQIITNYQRVQQGEKILNEIDRVRGY